MTVDLSDEDPLTLAETALAAARAALEAARVAVEESSFQVRQARADRDWAQVYALVLASTSKSVVDVPDRVPNEWSNVDSGGE